MTYIRTGEFIWESDGVFDGKYMADDGTRRDSSQAAIEHNRKLDEQERSAQPKDRDG